MRRRARVTRDENEIAFVCRGVEPWSPASDGTDLSEAQEAVINLCRELAKREWKITVYNTIPEQAEFDGVYYRPLGDFDVSDRFNVVVSWRLPSLFRDVSIEARKRFVDLHDLSVGPGTISPALIASADRFFFKSRFHRRLAAHVPDERAVVIANGVSRTDFELAVERDLWKLIHVGGSESALEVLVRRVWPQVLDAYPEATLLWCGAAADPAGRGHTRSARVAGRRLEREMSALGVVAPGRIGHQALATELASASIWIHPTRSPAASCITALKAQAAGCTPMTSGRGALQELVLEHEEDLGGAFDRHEAAVDGFVRRVLARLEQPESEETRRERARAILHAFDWAAIAEAWDRELRADVPVPARPRRRRSRKRSTICLNMIVRNEAHVVTEALDSVAPHVDYWVVVDTGSTDGTIGVIRSYFAARGIPGELHERPWQNFGVNRTEALNLALGKADYVWVIDADDVVIGDLDLDRLVADGYLLRYGSEFTYWRKQLFRSGARWRYEGVVHEYPVCLDVPSSEARVEGDYHVESRRLGDRNRARDKYERDSRLLLDALEENPDDERSVFYLAQSYFDAGDLRRARDFYGVRARMGGWDEEGFYALLRRAKCMELLGQPWGSVLAAYLDAWQSRAARAEPLYEIARLCRLQGKFELGYLFANQASEIPYPEDDRLFVAADIYRWRIADELAICAFYAGKHEESFRLCSSLLDEASVPESERERVLANRDFSTPRVKETTLAYPEGLVREIVTRSRHQQRSPEVTLSVTTCKRLDLFEKTINSFLNCCADVDRIGRWICVDDGSSVAERTRMQELYPFFEFVFKNARDKGHARSMNLILDEVASPFWLHLEDDWHFFARDRYVQQALAVLADDPRIGQVLFNRNYGETLECRDIVGGFVRRTKADGIRYRLHEHYDRDSPAHARFLLGLPPGTRSNAWWPHYSLRPALSRTADVKESGRFDPDAEHFELEFAQRYAAGGRVSAFLDSINCLHLGTLTSERDTTKPNAYALNDEPQFGRRRRRKRYRVQLMGNWTSPEELCALWGRQSEQHLRWGDLEVTPSPRRVDYHAIINYPPHGHDCLRKDRAIVFQMEPSDEIARWSSWASPDPREFLQVRSRDRYPSGVEWHLGLTYDELMTQPLEKTRNLSAVVSGKVGSAGQRLRVDFLKFLEQRGTQVDIFGWDNRHGFAGYNGRLPRSNKNAGILPYRYTFAAENTAETNYFTEKVVDAILGESLCFYWGCPNLEDYIDPEAFVRLPLEDFERSARIVHETMGRDEWSHRLPAIRRAKQKILTESQFFPTIARTVRGHLLAEEVRIKVVNLDRRPDRWQAFAATTEAAAGQRFASRCERYAAVDGRTLRVTPAIRRMFRGNDFGFRRGIVACALSHLRLWEAVADGRDTPCLVFEDDARVCHGFVGQLVEVCGQLQERHADFDLAFLGYHLWPPELVPRFHAVHLPPKVSAVNWDAFLGGTFAYMVSPAGARRLRALVDRDGIQSGIDVFVKRKASELNVVQCVPHVAFSSIAQPGSGIDSDIQYDFASAP